MRYRLRLYRKHGNEMRGGAGGEPAAAAAPATAAAAGGGLPPPTTTPRSRPSPPPSPRDHESGGAAPGTGGGSASTRRSDGGSSRSRLAPAAAPGGSGGSSGSGGSMSGRRRAPPRPPQSRTTRSMAAATTAAVQGSSGAGGATGTGSPGVGGSDEEQRAPLLGTGASAGTPPGDSQPLPPPHPRQQHEQEQLLQRSEDATAAATSARGVSAFTAAVPAASGGTRRRPAAAGTATAAAIGATMRPSNTDTAAFAASASASDGGTGGRDHHHQQQEQQQQQQQQAASGSPQSPNAGTSIGMERPSNAAILTIRCPILPPPHQYHHHHTISSSLPPTGTAATSSSGGGGSGNNIRHRKRTQQQGQGHYQRQPTASYGRHSQGTMVQVLVPYVNSGSGTGSTGASTSTTPGMTERELGRCIVQATGIGIVPSAADESGGYDDSYARYGADAGVGGGGPGSRIGEAPLAGLFRQSDGLFLPLSYVRTHASSLQGEILSITRPVRRPPPPPPPSPIWPYVCAGIVLSYIVARHVIGIVWENVLDVTLFYAQAFVMTMINLPMKLFNVLVEVPLRETYRYGPSFIGWEGQPLPRICAQVTFHGDEAFWSRNLEECQRIYAAKEAAALHVRKPILYILIACGLFFAIQSLVKTHAIRRQYRPDRNMVETYNAFNILLRQIQRGVMQHGRR
mmetsp:Transcript_2407/g.5529  ORF Transcript_2407/g.5529 Transcript_2407/m.5529 type:complete len:683 (-) Transcript_2407:59-2107(-)